MQPFLYGGLMSGDEVATGFVTFSVRVPAHLKVKLGLIAVRLGVAEAEVLRRLLERAVVPDEVLPVAVRGEGPVVSAGSDVGPVPPPSEPLAVQPVVPAVATGRPLERGVVEPVWKKGKKGD